MKINFEEQPLLDINWYFADSFNRLCVVASGGGFLPKFLLEERNQNDEFHGIVSELQEIFNIQRNPNILESIIDLEENNLEQYFQDFDSLAKRGFYVYDKINISNPEDDDYVLVAYPIYDTRRKDSLPINRDNLALIPRLNKPLISRTNLNFSKKNFNPIKLVSTIDDNQENK